MNAITMTACLTVGAAAMLAAPAALAQDHDDGHHRSGTPANDERVGEPYPLATCPVTGAELGSMGEPVVKLYDGREIRFCCGGCPPKFEKDRAAGLAKIDEQIVEDQQPLYPIETSIVSGKRLPEEPYAFVHGNRLILLTAEAEKAEFLKDADRYLEELNKAVIKAQGEQYVLTTCPVTGDAYGGAMGEPVDLVIAGRLIRLCCAGCEPDVEENPAKFINMVDEARKAHENDDHHHGGDV